MFSSDSDESDDSVARRLLSIVGTITTAAIQLPTASTVAVPCELQAIERAPEHSAHYSAGIPRVTVFPYFRSPGMFLGRIPGPPFGGWFSHPHDRSCPTFLLGLNLIVATRVV